MPVEPLPYENQAMLSTSAVVAQRLNEAFSASQLRQSDIAEACGVSRQAVKGWLNTGRIDKRHLSAVAALFQRDVEWFTSISGGDTSKPEEATSTGTPSPMARKVVEQLAFAAKENSISDQDWTLLGQIAERFSAASNMTHAIGAPIAPEHQAAMDRLAEEAEVHHEQSQQRRRTARR